MDDCERDGNPDQPNNGLDGFFLPMVWQSRQEHVSGRPNHIPFRTRLQDLRVMFEGVAEEIVRKAYRNAHVTFSFGPMRGETVQFSIKFTEEKSDKPETPSFVGQAIRIAVLERCLLLKKDTDALSREEDVHTGDTELSSMEDLEAVFNSLPMAGRIHGKINIRKMVVSCIEHTLQRHKISSHRIDPVVTVEADRTVTMIFATEWLH